MVYSLKQEVLKGTQKLIDRINSIETMEDIEEADKDYDGNIEKAIKYEKCVVESLYRLEYISYKEFAEYIKVLEESRQKIIQI